jgi:DNA polymerase-3 subunit delta'
MMHPRQTLALIGHDSLRQDLCARFDHATVPHALLFMGPAGVGKATFAYHLAYSLFKGSLAQLGVISADDPLYRRIAAHAHGDLLVLERSKRVDGKMPRDITVEEACRVSDFLEKTPLEGGWRVVIVDSVDEMNRQAMNALLKKLEEPPRNSLLILICHHPGRLLPTIVSRCQRVIFRPLSPAELEKIIHYQHTPYILDSAEMRLLIRIAEGSAGRALRLLRHDGLRLYNELQQALLHLRQGEWGPSLALARECVSLSQEEAGQERFLLLGELLGYFIANGVQEVAFHRASSTIEAFFQPWPLDRWAEIWERIQALFQESHRLSFDPFQVMIAAFEMLAAPDKSYRSDSLVRGQMTYK